ncbi:MAG TPA: glycosyltransferase family 4 protein [Vicinamibacterales bacterium]|nr:glycosyltransferase family 4 protein [Vicinamibacterales bacterium]
MRSSLRSLLVTDAFPPVCGGSGWSTYELARGLRARGHEVVIVQPRPAMRGTREAQYDDFQIHEFGAPAPDVPYVRNYFKSERLTRSLTAFLSGLLSRDRFDIVHGQHVMTSVAAIDAARGAGVPVVATVRDYWPVCYWSDLLYTRDGLALCPECTAGNMIRCVGPRGGALWPLAVPMIPYMRANLAWKREGLSRADAIVAVSRQIAGDLRRRAPELRSARIEVIPNPVDVARLRAAAAARSNTAPPGPYALYVGKLARNKGTDFLIDVVAQAELDWPLIVAGDGPDRAAMERQAAASGRDIRMAGWLDRDETAKLIGHAGMLIFPSRGPESLSRVLIEASALGTPIAAMETGGTRDIIDAGVTGLLSSTPQQLAADVRRLRADDALRRRLGSAARDKIEREFDTAVVVSRMERLYADLARIPLEHRERVAGSGGAKSPDK